MSDDAIDFGTGEVGVLFRRLFFPTLLGMLGMSAVTAVDGIFVGHCVGSDGIAAINIVIPVLMLLTGIGLMVGSGCSVVASIHLARGKVKVARLNVTQALLAVTVVAVVLTCAMLADAAGTARVLGASQELLPLVVDYMVWYVPSWVFMVWTAVALFVIRLDGAPRMAMACSLVTALLNVLLDWLFMFPLGWGVMGAALATSLSTVAGGVMTIGYLLFAARRLRLVRLKMSAKSMRLTVRNIGYQCRVGLSALLGEATMAVGAFGIICYYAPFIFMVGNAIAQSAQPIISYNFGLGDLARTRQAEKVALATAAICGLTVTGAFSLLPQSLVGLFVPLDCAAAGIAVDGMPLFATGFVCFIFNLTAVGYFQRVERMLPATVFALMRGVVLLVPSFVVMPLVFGTRGIWLAMPVAEGLTAVAVIAFYFYGRARDRGKV